MARHPCRATTTAKITKEDAEMETPSSKWRVYTAPVREGEHKSFRSENKAYEYVREQVPLGHRVIVHFWEYGRWGLYEVLEPEKPATPEEV